MINVRVLSCLLLCVFVKLAVIFAYTEMMSGGKQPVVDGWTQSQNPDA